MIAHLVSQTAESPAERFLELCELKRKEALAIRQPNPVLSVALEGDNRIRIILRNRSRWIVQRNRDRV